MSSGLHRDVDDSQCVRAARPSSQEVCSAEDCPGRWESNAFGSCSRSCGNGTQTRVVLCKQIKAGGQDETVTESECRPLPQPKGRRRCNAHNCPAVWATFAWGTCSATCAGGRQIRTVTCERIFANSSKLVEEPSQCPAQLRPPATQACNEQDCAAEWVVQSDWEACSHTCGGVGRQSRRVECRRRTTGGFGLVDDSLCLAQRMPARRRECQRLDCPAYWQSGEFGSCSVTCAGGTQRRTVQCRAMLSTGNDEVVDETRCPGERPAEIRECRVFHCQPYWQELPWQGCSRECGRGEEQREVVCLQHLLGEDGETRVDMSECVDKADGARPVTQRYCAETDCDPIWETSEYEDCAISCGGSTHRRDVICRQLQSTGRWETVLDGNCLLSERPLEEKGCALVDCPAKWRVTEFSDCPVTCGGDQRTRQVFCEVLRASSEIEEVAHTECPQTSVPLPTLNCGAVPCPAVWETDGWSRPLPQPPTLLPETPELPPPDGSSSTCSVTCGGGIQVRNIRCEQVQATGELAIVDDSVCESALRPLSQQPCNAIDCPTHWDAGQYRACSRSCGNGTQSREVFCERVNAEGRLVKVASTLCNPQSQPAVNRRCQVEDCPETWITSTWSDCSQTCGRGSRDRGVFCEQNQASGDTVLVDTENCPAPSRPSERENCNSIDCAARWRIGQYDECSLPCGNGSQSRSIVCEQLQGDGEIRLVGDSLCPQPRPALTQRCSEIKCSAVYRVGEYGECSLTCSGGTKSRTVHCEQIQESGKLIDVPRGLCLTFAGPAPARIDSCNVIDCPAYWQSSDFGSCSVTCAGGTQRRTVQCRAMLSTGNDEVVDETRCPGARPAEIRECSAFHCQPYWQELPWQGCSRECGRGEDHREVVCLQHLLGEDGETRVDMSECVDKADGARPVTQRYCAETDCDPIWETSEYEDCAISCGGSTHRRDVICRQLQSTGRWETVLDGKCLLTERPLEEKGCALVDCPAKWRVTEFSDCPVTCGGDQRTRQVFCEVLRASSEIEEVAHAECPQTSVPMPTLNCGEVPCPAVWETDGWSRPLPQPPTLLPETTELPPPDGSSSTCSVTCGGGIQVRNIRCEQVQATGELMIVDDSVCESALRPINQQPCNAIDCPTHWDAGQYQACSRSCGNGTQSREVFCERVNAEGRLVKVASTLCNPQSQPAVNRRCQVEDCPETWITSTWSDCSQTCGRGSRDRGVFCEQNQASGDTVLVDAENCPAPSRPSERENCNSIDCAARWRIGQYDECSLPCGNGSQSRSIVCEQLQGDGEIRLVDDSLCPQPRPALTRRCSEIKCPAVYHVGQYGECSLTCSGGTKSRTVDCEQIQESGKLIDVPHGLCLTFAGPAQARIDSCNVIDCPAIWDKGPWNACSQTCGRGTRTREVTCKRTLSDKRLITEPNSDCPQESEPDNIEYCSAVNCPPEFIVGNFDACSKTCGNGTQQRTLQCQRLLADGNLQPLALQQCPESSVTPASRFCSEVKCPGKYRVGNYGACTQTCSTGRQFRSVDCEQVQGSGELMDVAISECVADLGAAPAEVQDCNALDCTPIWIDEQWGECTLTCGRGVQRRRVLCEQTLTNGTMVYVDPQQCPASTEPINIQACNAFDCPGHWDVEDYNTCSKTCGNGTQSRRVFCEQLQQDNVLREVDDSVCDPTVRPAAAQRCNVNDCPPIWIIEEFDECTLFCGNGTQERPVYCQQTKASGENVMVPDQDCSVAGAKVPTVQRCNEVDCFGAWIEEEYEACNVTCGGGAQDREVFCLQLQASGLEVRVQDFVCLPAKPDMRRECGRIDCSPEWRELPYRPCSATCGGGTQTRRVYCEQLTAEGSLQTVGDEQCPQPRPALERGCGASNCDSYWSKKLYRECSVTCGGGIQVRRVLCQQLLGSGDTVVIPEGECDPALKPPTERACQVIDCPSYWNESAYQDCSVTCGGGEQFRTVVCQQLKSTSQVEIVEDPDCVDAGPHPATRQTCNQINCPAYWEEPEFTLCNASCGVGHRQRTVLCRQLQADSQLRFVEDDVCDLGTGVRPVAEEQCNVIDCTPYWVTGEYEQCTDECGGGTQDRWVGCEQRLAGGQLVNATLSVCRNNLSALMPDVRRDCNVINCPPYWNVAEYSECSEECGGGTKQRNVQCQQVKATGNLEDVMDGDCPGPVPARQMECNVVDCLPEWETLLYATCPVTCGGGIQTRVVQCKRLIANGSTVIVPNSVCDSLLLNVPRPVDRRQCNTVNCPALWRFEDWQPCSRTCGGGLRERLVACEQRKGNGALEDVVPELCILSRMPIAVEECQVVKCPAYWQPQPFNECSRTCGGGRQTRSVVCDQVQERGDLVTVDDDECDEASRPADVRDCNRVDCLAEWRALPYGDCSLLCGNGTQERVILCEQLISNGSTMIVSEQDCPVPKPATVRHCNQIDCDGRWLMSPYDECSRSCGGGSQSRRVVCQQLQASGRLDEVTDDVCASEPKPSLTRTCNVINCPGYWNATAYGACTESCGTGTQRRQVFCHQVQSTGDLVVVDDGICPVQSQLPDVRECNVHDCPPIWVRERYLACSQTCGNGSQSRTVFCQQRLATGNVDVVVADADCPQPKPAEQQRCSEIDCIPYWQAEEFSECTLTCGAGTKSREVRCLQLQSTGLTVDVQFENCLEDMPAPVEPCNVIACPPVWIADVYYQCTVSCGGGTQQRDVYCEQVQPEGALARVHDDVCSGAGLAEPASLRACNVVDCPTFWQPYGFEPCSRDCGNGSQSRLVQCQQVVANGSTVVVDDLQCDAPSMPPRQQRCSEVSCSAYWHPNEYGECTVTCGGGVQDRIVQCLQLQATGQRVAVDDLLCEFDLRPVEIQACRQTDCPPEWHTTAYGECSVTCGGGRKRRAVTCQQLRGDGVTLPVSDSQCAAAGLRPDTENDCGNVDCSPEWRPLEFTPCSRTCGGGTRTRAVLCEQLLGSGVTVPRDDSACIANDKPAVIERCMENDCDHIWVYQTWSECSQTCGRGTRRRTVFCEQLLGNRTLLRIPDNECSAESMPPHEEFCSVVDCTPFWVSDAEWRPCSRSCGTGGQSRDVWCEQLQASGDQVVVADTLCTADSRPADQQQCNVLACPPIWRTAPWGDCSLACGGVGTQDRFVYCEATLASGEIVNTTDSECPRASRPPTRQACQAPNCAPEWELYEYSACTRSCATGQQQRAVECEQVISTGVKILVDDDQCPGLKPQTVRECNAIDCLPGTWQAMPWNGCSKSCATGSQSRIITCEQRKANGQLEVVDDSICVAALRPVETRTCNSIDCPARWYADEWTTCSQTCGNGIQRRRVYCSRILANGSRVQAASVLDCANAFPPISSRPCFPVICPATWRPQQYSDCSASCGGDGFQTRDILCQQDLEGGAIQTVADTECSGQRPLERQDCSRVDCPARYYSSSFTECSTPCAGGLQSRTVECRVLRGTGTDGVVANTECQRLRLRQPAPRQRCNTQSCPARWVPSAWRQCSATCGTGQQQRRLSCFQRTVDGDNQVSRRLCQGLASLPVVQDCATQRCPPRWVSGQYGTCTHTCGAAGTQTRRVECQFSNGEIADEAQCTLIKPAAARQCNIRNCAPRWSFAAWQECSESCGIGVQRRTVRCQVLQYTGRTIPIGSAECAGQQRPIDSRTCAAVACPAMRTYGQYGQCNATCGGGVEISTGVCQQISAAGVLVAAPGQCESEPAILTRPCNNDLCPGVWVPGAWSECSSECGEGTRTREILCLDVRDRRTRLPDNNCAGGEFQKEILCNNPPCRDGTLAWDVGEWAQCTRSCGSGVQERSVVCTSTAKDTGVKYIVVNTLCAHLPKPDGKKSCREVDCPGEWVLATTYGECSTTCGTNGVQTRPYICKVLRSTGFVEDATAHFCNNSGPQPPTRSRPCVRVDCTAAGYFTWHAIEWSRCSVECDQRRQIWCHNPVTREYSGDASCVNVTVAKPSDHRRCQEDGRGTYKWIPTNWTQCSRSCGGGWKTRDVKCRNVVANNEARSCPICIKPAERMECNTQPCTEGINQECVDTSFAQCNRQDELGGCLNPSIRRACCRTCS
ncbi:SCO-spondin-like [Sycon ciliatum]|uniref:SCO-spondin-like n=1 Tax=Sycon ciliatum TaxID=27933 RepID=UPI0031F6E78C